MLSKYPSFLLILIAGFFLASCRADGNYPGREFAPNMYHSVAYEPLKQITDTDAGWMVTSTEHDTVAEYYNSNRYNPHRMNMRLPVPGTIPRRVYLNQQNNADVYFTSKHIPADSIEISARILKNPVPLNDEILSEGEVLYLSFCAPCHGETGKGEGLVGQQYKGIPNFAAGRTATLSEGHIWHTITYGRGRMWPYASQIDPQDRWKIVHYIQKLQSQK